MLTSIFDLIGWLQLRYYTFKAGLELREWRICLYALGINVLIQE